MAEKTRARAFPRILRQERKKEGGQQDEKKKPIMTTPHVPTHPQPTNQPPTQPQFQQLQAPIQLQQYQQQLQQQQMARLSQISGMTPTPMQVTPTATTSAVGAPPPRFPANQLQQLQILQQAQRPPPAMTASIGIGQPTQQDAQILTRPKLQELVKQVAPHERLDPEVEEVITFYFIQGSDF